MRNRVIQISNRVSKTLTKVCKILDIKENITWYSARGTFISRMVDAGCSPAVTAEQAGNEYQKKNELLRACKDEHPILYC